jgi:hypothetical protein
LNGNVYPEHFLEFFEFLCDKYAIDKRRLFVEYSSSAPPPLKGGRLGYYDGLLSYRKRNGRPEFLITVYSISHNPLLTLAHEFAHLVADLKSGQFGKQLGPPNDLAEKAFDIQAVKDIAEFKGLGLSRTLVGSGARR